MPKTTKKPRVNNQHDSIVVKGARVHNLKNIDVTIPRDQLVVITGLSGSGKSSLAFDTIYAEGQRRYVESLSAYARQFLGLMDKPDVDQIDGLSPAISIDQKTTSQNPRSTVGTVTEIYDYLRLLYARVGIPHCPKCGDEVSSQTPQQILKTILAIPKGENVILLAPFIRDKKGEHRGVFEKIQKAGYKRLRLDGEVITIEEALDKNLDKQIKHSIDVVIDRVVINKDNKDDKQRLADSLNTALDLGDGLIMVNIIKDNEDIVLSEHFSCAKCGINLPPLEPRNFSFNSPHGACSECTGLGTKLEVDSELVIPNPKLTIAQGAIRPWSRTSSNQGWYMRILNAAAEANDFSVDIPVSQLTKAQLGIVLNGTGSKKYQVDWDSSSFTGEMVSTFEGVIPNLERRHRETESDYVRNEIEQYMRILPCPSCEGKRLQPGVLGVTVGDKNISELTTMTISDAEPFFKGLVLKSSGYSLGAQRLIIAKPILKEVGVRLRFLRNVGLDYLTLDRSAATLSGGEAQRIRLATQIGSSLMGVIYILDEPSIGLHQRDNDKLIGTLKDLRDLGNTVLVVEHDKDMIEKADYVIDIGPGAGEKGGKVIAVGTPDQIRKNTKSLTGKYLSGKESIALPKKYRNGNGKSITVRAAEEHNLKKIDVKIPLGKFVCITGVSGSGKSTLMTDIIAKALSQYFHRAKANPGKHKQIDGLEHLDKTIVIDQSPIGRTPRSNPATYTGLFTPIRELFTQLPESKLRGYGPGRFSFNVKGGRCEACQGDGMVKIEMHFLPDVYVECEECHSKRYNHQTLEIHYRGKTIADILAMTVEEAMNFFAKIPNIHTKLKTLHEVGLGYIQLGQSATTLSGGEAQRVKLATELARRATGKTLYILDEPTTGLHFDDVKRLLYVLNQLVDKGNSMLVIEHNLDVIKYADWIIDLGPGGGDKGGEVVAEGSPKDIVKIRSSYTAQYLKREL